MASINFNNVCVDFPIYNASSRSLKNKLIQIATGGQLGVNESGAVIVRALEDLTFTFKDGDRVGLLGHNGAGKSTLLRLLNGVYWPSSGSLTVTGKTSSLIDIYLGIDPEITGRQNAYLRGALLGISRAEITKQMNNIIEFSELGNFIDMPMRIYSTGMHLRLAFVVSTILHTEILLMVELSSVGDESFKHKAEKRMAELVQSANILVIATHSRGVIQAECNRVIWLEHGRIKMDANPDLVIPLYFGAGY